MIQRPWVLGVIAAFLLASICYCVGIKKGHLDERLSINAQAIKENGQKSSIDSAKVDTARKHSDSLLVEHTVIREKVRVQHDSVFARDTVYVNSDIASLIVTADSTIAAQQRSLALQDSLIASLRIGISLRDTRIKLLESEVTPSKTSKFFTAAKWLTTGAVVGFAVAHR